jgi:hypothetical protein
VSRPSRRSQWLRSGTTGQAFWGRHDRAQRKRETEYERNIAILREEPSEHVRIWEAFDALAKILGRDAAMAAWLK